MTPEIVVQWALAGILSGCAAIVLALAAYVILRGLWELFTGGW